MFGKRTYEQKMSARMVRMESMLKVQNRMILNILRTLKSGVAAIQAANEEEE